MHNFSGKELYIGQIRLIEHLYAGGEKDIGTKLVVVWARTYDEAKELIIEAYGISQPYSNSIRIKLLDLDKVLGKP